MSNRHIHVTGFLYDPPEEIAQFIEALQGRFSTVTPLIRDGGRVIAVAFESRDLGDLGDELFTLPDAVEALAGILTHDIQIVSAWEGGHERERVWTVRGRTTRV